MDLIKMLEKKQLKEDIPEFGPGDRLQVKVKVVEGGKERLQTFEGDCIVRKGGGLQENFTLRKISHGGIGVERSFMLHSPMLKSVKVVREGKVRRARLFYLRDKVGKKARIKENVKPGPEKKSRKK
ncbi:MAG: 50S ribosomal protein L19 [Chloroflexi bacterium]|nr:50S ribosomal protein L19 [Chloroflexota bacterium]